MTISEALKIAVTRSEAASQHSGDPTLRWTYARLAFTAGVTETTARRWIAGSNTIPGDALMALRKSVPGFADILDGKEVAAA